MLTLLNAGAIGPFQPKSSKATAVMLIIACCVFATTQGYDSALMNGINIMPQYSASFQLTTVTLALQTCASFIGWGIASLTMGPVVEKVGRKCGVIIAVVLKLIGVSMMTAASNGATFVIGRIFLGYGTGTAAVAASSWLAETLPPKIRGLGLSITYSVYYVGALFAAGVTYGTANMTGSWSWRLPCLLQGIFSVGCAIVLFFTPESPRWLEFHERREEALAVVASLFADGDAKNTVVLQQYQEITDTLEWERNATNKKLTYMEMARTPGARKRMTLSMSVAVIGMMSGNNIIAYYLGQMLDNAGITNETTQLQINIILNAWSLMCSMIGTYYMDKAGRKPLGLGACIAMTITIFLVGGLTKAFGTSTNTSGVYATVAMIFLFQGAYSIGITPLTQLYSAEVLNYSIRANGMAVWAMIVTISGFIATFAFPVAMAKISWKLYMINGAWDVLQCIYVAIYWIETKNLTLEEIDRLLDGVKPNDMPDAKDLKEDSKVLDGVEIQDVSDVAVSEQIEKEKEV